jgi:hypothetical protein
MVDGRQSAVKFSILDHSLVLALRTLRAQKRSGLQQCYFDITMVKPNGRKPGGIVGGSR